MHEAQDKSKEIFVLFKSKQGTVKSGKDENLHPLGYGKLKVTAIVKGKE